MLVAVALGAAGLLVLQAWLDDVRNMAVADARRILAAAFVWTGAIAVASLLGLALYLWRIGARICAAARFPLPGARVVRDTVVLHGGAALRRGRFLQWAGAALAVCALALLAAGWRLYVLLLAHAP